MTNHHGALGPDAEVTTGRGRLRARQRVEERMPAPHLVRSLPRRLCGDVPRLPDLLSADAGARRADRRAAGARLHRPARLRARLVLRLAARQRDGGRACSLFTLTPFANWGRQHSLHHADWNNLDRTGGGADIYSSCLTVRSYLALSPWRRFFYRLPRHPLIANVLLPPLVFLLLYRVPFDTPRGWVRERRSVYLTNAALICLFGTLAMLLGWREVLMVHCRSWSWRRSWASGCSRCNTASKRRAGRSRATGASSRRRSRVVMVPPAARLHWLTGNIGFHHVHHLNPRVPNYRLRDAHEVVHALASGAAAHPVARPRRDVPHLVGRAARPPRALPRRHRLKAGSAPNSDRPQHWTHWPQGCRAFASSPMKPRPAMAERGLCSRPNREVHA